MFKGTFEVKEIIFFRVLIRSTKLFCLKSMKKDFFLQFGARACPVLIPRCFSYSSGITAKFIKIILRRIKEFVNFSTEIPERESANFDFYGFEVWTFVTRFLLNFNHLKFQNDSSSTCPELICPSIHLYFSDEKQF